jgi:hypothetical protein
MAERLADRRRYKRYEVEGIQGNIRKFSDLNVTNVSIGGIAIETINRLDIDKEYTFKIEDKNSFINIKGCSVWSVLSQAEDKATGNLIPIYMTGIKFMDILNERVNMLMNFIEENRMATSERRLRGTRFKVTTSENVKICYPYRYDVKRISLSGMEMMTEQPLTPGSQHEMELILNKKVLNINGRITNCKEVSSRKFVRYKVGIAFIEVTDTDRQTLKSFLDPLK